MTGLTILEEKEWGREEKPPPNLQKGFLCRIHRPAESFFPRDRWRKTTADYTHREQKENLGST